MSAFSYMRLYMRLRGRFLLKMVPSILGTMLLVACLVACSDDSTGPTSVAKAHVRVVNSVVQNTTPVPTPLAIDYLINGNVLPGFQNISALSVAGMDSAAGYRSVSPGVYTFVAKTAGTSTELYTTTTNEPYVPTQYIGAGTYNTIVVSGVIPASGPIPNATVPFVILQDDPFPGPVVAGTRHARFRLIHAAPYGRGSIPGLGDIVQLTVTPGNTPPPLPITQYAPTTSARYGLGQSSYINLAPGTYFFTIRLVNTTTFLVQQPVTLSAGEVWTFVLQSTAAGPPSVANHKLVALRDQVYPD